MESRPSIGMIIVMIVAVVGAQIFLSAIGVGGVIPRVAIAVLVPVIVIAVMRKFGK